jgi:hypothetical protein
MMKRRALEQAFHDNGRHDAGVPRDKFLTQTIMYR